MLSNRIMGIGMGDEKAEVQAEPIVDTKQVSTIVEKFRCKYGADDVRKYYSKFDAAITAQIQ